MSSPDTKLITGTIAPDTKLTAQTNPELVSLDSSMTFHTGSREVLRITNEARLVIGDGLSKEEATQETAKLLIAAFDERIQEMVDKRAEKAEERLEWLERFLQHGGTSISTVSPYTLEDHPDDTDETQFNLPFQIGISVEMENRGCYK